MQTIVNIIGATTVAIIIVGACFGIYRWINPVEPVPETTQSTFSDGCEFYRKVMGGEMVISEPEAGTYRYEVIATRDGIEVWKCNPY